MRKLQLLLTLVTFLVVGYVWQTPTEVMAANELTNCSLSPREGKSYVYSEEAGSGIGEILGPQSVIPLTFTTDFSPALLEQKYDMSTFEIGICNGICNGAAYSYYFLSSGQITRSGNQFTVRLPASQHKNGEFRAVLRARELTKSENTDVCPEKYPAFKVSSSGNIPPANNCSTSLLFSPTILTNTDKNLTVTFNTAALNDSASYWLEFDENNVQNSQISEQFKKSGTDLFGSGRYTVPTTRVGNTVTANFTINSVTNGGKIMLRANGTNGQYAACTKTIAYDPTTGNAGETTGQTGIQSFAVCNQIPAGPQKDECESCYPEGIWTAVGCIETNAKSIVTQVIQIGLGLSGGVALLMIVAAGFLLSTSQNDPKKVTEAKEMVTSAVIGMLFIIFSVTILQFIGVTILKIPGFGS